MRVDPSASWEHIPVLREKINELISAFNGEEEVTPLTYEEKVEKLQLSIQIELDRNDFELVAKLSEDLKKLTEGKDANKD